MPQHTDRVNQLPDQVKSTTYSVNSEKPELSTGNLYTPLGRLAANASHAVQTERAHA